MYGPLKYADSSDHKNLQISSSHSISLGLGTVKKNGAVCNPTDASRSAGNTSDSSYSAQSSLRTFFRDMYTTANNFLRNGIDPLVFGQTNLDEAAKVEAGEGTLLDASCRSEGRGVSFKFAFDPVFNSVNALPMLDRKLILDVIYPSANVGCAREDPRLPRLERGQSKVCYSSRLACYRIRVSTDAGVSIAYR